MVQEQGEVVSKMKTLMLSLWNHMSQRGNLKICLQVQSKATLKRHTMKLVTRKLKSFKLMTIRF